MAEKNSFSGNWVLVAVWAAALSTVFVAFRYDDLLRLPQLVGNLGGRPFAGPGAVDSLIGLLVAGLILVAWFGLGTLIFRFVPGRPEVNSWLRYAQQIAVGAAAWSLIWFFLGLAGLYNQGVAIACIVLGIVGIAFRRDSGRHHSEAESLAIFDRLIVGLIGVVLLLAFIGSLAPPTAKDTLLYHFSVPKAFILQGSNAFIEGNIASYLPLGVEMHVVWAMLLGGLASSRAAEAAAGATTFLFLPVLLTAIYGWAREMGISRPWSLVSAFTVAAIPTAYHVASSGYVDLALALYVMLAVHALTHWWKTGSSRSLVLIVTFLGAALAIKLTALFVIAAFALVILLRARKEEGGAGKIAGLGFAALLLAGVIASPWYLRNWAATGSPVFPFYMNIWEGRATGWDVERSTLFQAMNSQYGGVDTDKVNYLTAPLRLSLAGQPEDHSLYDGVLGPAFIIGLPVLIWAIWRRRVGVEILVAVGVAGVVYLFWLFSSQQLRYLLPIVPLVAIGIAASGETIASVTAKKVWKYSLVFASLLGVITSVAWFCQRAPVRVVLGGESRDEYLARNLDHYPYYRWINNETDPNTKAWLINMRRDSYYIERPIFSDYIFEDWTLRKMVWESRSLEELRAKTAAIGVKYVLARHDFLFDYDRSTLVDDKRPRAESEAKLAMARAFLLDEGRTVKADKKFSLIKTFSE